MSKKGDAYTIHIDVRKLSRLLRSRILYINKDNERKSGKKIKVLDNYEDIIISYFDKLFNEAILTGGAVRFPNIGYIKVVKKISSKGYNWDTKYNGKDYELVVESDMAIFKTDESYYKKIIENVDNGFEYEYDAVNYYDRVDEILNLINGKSVSRTKRRRVKAIS